MVRQFSVILGIGLIVLWIAGLSSPFAPAWLSWLDGVAALAAFVVAGSAQQKPFGIATGANAIGPFAVSIGLFALWIIALSTAAVTWMAWWTFAFACAFLALGIAAVSRKSTFTSVGSGDQVRHETMEDRFRKSA